MPRAYRYVGPPEIRARSVRPDSEGREITKPEDLAAAAVASGDEPLTYIVAVTGELRVAPRRSEHVACAGGKDVLSAGELTFDSIRNRITEISNQSTGYCPEPESWPHVAAALDRAGVVHPGRFTYEAIFRRCPMCNERNLVKDDWYECALCEAKLPKEWNFEDRP